MILTEAAIQRNLAQAAPNVPGRSGFEWGVPAGGVTPERVRAQAAPRMQLMEQLYDAYVKCEPTANCVDVTSRAVTAGGVILVPDDDVPDGQEPVEPPNVEALRLLMRFTNPREDLVQVLRGVVADLEIFGDAYLEVSEVNGVPVALYSLDAASMSVMADEHGQVTGYEQYIDQSRTVKFNPDQVIHFSLDSPRGGLYGVSPVQKSLISVTSWLFTATCLLETMRRGDPPRLHVDLPRGLSNQDQQKWYEQYMVRNLGARNIGTPIITTGGGTVNEHAHSKVTDYLETLKHLRDDIFQVHGVAPNKGSVVESGNLGGGTGESQDKNWHVTKIIPIRTIILEKLNYSLCQVGFGIVGWHMDFDEIDFRDSTVVEGIRKMRLETGAYTLNRYRSEIGEPEVDGGEVPILLLQKGSAVAWQDIEQYTSALLTSLSAAAQTAPPMAGAKPEPAKPDAAAQGKAPKEARGADAEMRALNESFAKAYQHRRRKVLKGLPAAEGSAPPLAPVVPDATVKTEDD